PAAAVGVDVASGAGAAARGPAAALAPVPGPLSREPHPAAATSAAARPAAASLRRVVPILVVATVISPLVRRACGLGVGSGADVLVEDGVPEALLRFADQGDAALVEDVDVVGHGEDAVDVLLDDHEAAAFLAED